MELVQVDTKLAIVENIKEETLSYLYCSPCDRRYQTERQLKDHNRFKHGENTKCQFCANTFSSKSSCIRHISLRHTNSYFFCSQCGSRWSRRYYLERHQPRCGRTTRRKVTFSDHKCPSCDKYFINKSTFTKHVTHFHDFIVPSIKSMLRNTREIISCDHCSQVFRKKSNLTKHMKIHNAQLDENKLISLEICKHCQLTFASRNALGKHLKHKHADKSLHWQCDICEKIFSNRKNHLQHKRVHQSGSFMCPDCKRIYKFRRNMVLHRKKKCSSIKMKPWDQINRKSKRRRMQFILKNINNCDIPMDLNNKLCIYKSLLAMSEDEKDIFQDLIYENSLLCVESKGKELMTVEDVIDKVREQWTELECQYCGEDARNIADLQKHLAQFHPSQVK